MVCMYLFILLFFFNLFIYFYEECGKKGTASKATWGAPTWIFFFCAAIHVLLFFPRRRLTTPIKNSALRVRFLKLGLLALAKKGKEMPTLTTKEAVLVSAKRRRRSQQTKETPLVVAKGCHHFAILS